MMSQARLIHCQRVASLSCSSALTKTMTPLVFANKECGAAHRPELYEEGAQSKCPFKLAYI